MDAVVIILSAVVGMGFIVFLKQYEKLKKAQSDYRSAVQQVSRCNSKLRTYREYLRELLPHVSNDVLMDSKGRTLDACKDAECCKFSPQRDGKIVACREIVNLIDEVIDAV